MHTVQSVRLTAFAFQCLAELLNEVEFADSDIIHARGLAFIAEEHNRHYDLDHTEAHIFRSALRVIYNLPAKSPLERLRQLSAENLIGIMDMHTTVKVVEDNGLTTGEYVVLEGIEHLNRFFTRHIPGNDPLKLADGTIGYKLLGYANSVEEAQQLIGIKPYDLV